MTDEFWTPEEDAEFADAERDDEAAAQAVEDQFPAGWIEVGATREGIVIGPAEIYTAPVESPIFEAIDRASADRTPVLETTVTPGDSWLKFKRAVEKATVAFTEFSRYVTPDTGGQDHATWKREMLEQIYGPMGSQPRRVALMGTGYRRHASPGERHADESRAEHARRRRLYSERLRRDRRRRRAGRAPILRSSAFQALIPHAQLDARKAGPEAAGMEIVLSAMVPDDQVYVVDNSLLDQFVQPYELEPPKLFDRDARRWRSMELFGRGYGRTHRATNYLIQADEPRRRGGYRPSRMWVDDVEVDVDTWMNEGGADHG